MPCLALYRLQLGYKGGDHPAVIRRQCVLVMKGCMWSYAILFYECSYCIYSLKCFSSFVASNYAPLESVDMEKINALVASRRQPCN